MGSLTIRALVSDDVDACEGILRALPDWFGIERSIVGYVRDVLTMPTLVASIDRRIVGFVTIRRHSPYAAEVQVMALHPDHHRRGIGRRLLHHTEDDLRRRGAEYLHLKTRGPSAPDPHYDRTRAFYEAMGFRGIEETTAFWGEADPCLIMVKRL